MSTLRKAKNHNNGGGDQTPQLGVCLMGGAVEDDGRNPGTAEDHAG
jgi:hypothetical protein